MLAKLADRRSRAAWIALAAAAFLAVTAITYLIAYPRMFTGFMSYDDEGYMLTALSSFLDHGGLYDDVFTQYGPFYYEAWGAVFSVLGIPVTHDGGRIVTLVVWVASSLALGLATVRMTGSVLLGLATQMLVFASLGTLTNEPMHPGGLVVLLLATIVAFSCLARERESVGAMALLGGAVAALILVKINVGGFALVALALACAVSYAPLDRRRVRLPVEIAFVLLPLALMSGKLGEAWARSYALHVVLAALAVVIVLRARPGRRRRPEELWWLAGGLLAVGAASCLAILASGTTPGGLLDGLIGQPLRQTDAFSLPFQMSDRLFLLDGVALAAAIGYRYVAAGGSRDPAPFWTAGVAAFSILVGVEMALSPIGRGLPFDATGLGGYQLSLLAFAWVALLPAPGRPVAAAGFARLLLPPLAVLQALHAFPVAGSQVLWSAFLLVPVGAICVGNGVAALARGLGGGREARAAAAVAAVAAVALLGFVANTTLREPLRDARAAYDSGVALDLPGARHLRVGAEEADLYRQITAAIDANCASLVMLPGMNSFYTWAEMDPPTGYNATGWPTLFDAGHQRRVIEDVERAPGLCLLENESLAAWWSGGAVPAGPLVGNMRRRFRPLLEIGEYRLLTRPEGAS